MVNGYNYNTNTWEDLTTEGMLISQEFTATYDIQMDVIILIGRTPNDSHKAVGYHYNTNQFIELSSSFTPHGRLSASYDVGKNKTYLNNIKYHQPSVALPNSAI